VSMTSIIGGHAGSKQVTINDKNTFMLKFVITEHIDSSQCIFATDKLQQ